MFFSVNMSVSWVSNQVKIGDFGLSKMADASPEGIIELSTRGAGTSWPLDLVYGLVPPLLHVQMCCSISFLHSYVWVAFCLVGLAFALVWPLVGRSSAIQVFASRVPRDGQPHHQQQGTPLIFAASRSVSGVRRLHPGASVGRK